MFIPMIVRISTTRMREGFASRWIWLVVWSLISATVGVGSGNSGATTSRASVRRLDVRETPELEGLAQRARDFANVTYPKIVDLLVEDPSSVPSEFDLIFKKSLARDKTGVTKNTRIFVNTGFFDPDSTKLGPENEMNLRLVLVHEMGHVAQQYRGMAPFYWTRAPGYWEEGIADYVRYKLGATNALTCLECAEAYPHYTSGYFCEIGRAHV